MKHVSLGSAVSALSAALLAVALSGCGVGVGMTSVSNVKTAVVTGQVKGAPFPISGATVTLYETQVGDGATPGSAPLSTYTTAAKALATTTTGNFGQFTFATGYTCDVAPYMQYAYVVVTGGNTGSGVNDNVVEMAALGPCSSLATSAAQGATQVYVSEATTVASAYALSWFISETGGLGTQVVNVSSTPTNDATTPACTGTGATLSCQADGLGHAFDNATALASGVSFTGAAPTGFFNTSMPNFPGSAIPQAMLNGIAAALQTCVNSTGGAEGDGSACGDVFAAMPSPAPTTFATDTLMATVNLAKNPNATGVPSGDTSVYGLGSTNVYYTPQLAAGPGNYGLAVYYPGGNYFAYPQNLALDIDDNVYVYAANGNTTTTGQATTTTASGLGALGYNASGQISPLFSANLSVAGYNQPGFIAVDTRGNVYLTNQSTDPSGQNDLRVYNGPANILAGGTGGTATSTFTTIDPTYGSGVAQIEYPSSIAIDQSSNVWIGTGALGTTAAMYELAGSLTPATETTVNSTTYSAPFANSGGIYGMAVDQNQNIWGCTQSLKGYYPEILLYPASGGTPGTTLYYGYSSALASGVRGATANDGLSVDSAGNVYCATKNGMEQAVAVGTASPAANPTVEGQVYSVSATLANNPSGGEIDGNGTFWEGGASNAPAIFGQTFSGIGTNFAFASTTAVTIKFDPCYPALSSGGGVYCSNNAVFTTTTTPVKGAVEQWSDWSQIDATGSVWFPEGAVLGSTGAVAPGVIQIIGVAAPTWPLLAYGKPGVMP